MMRRVLDVWVPGIPKTQGSKDNLGRGKMREVSNRDGALDVWRDRVRTACEKAAVGSVARDEVAFARCVFLVIARSDLGALWATGDGDGDKLERAVWDAVTASGAWVDDAQVVRWTGTRVRIPGYQVPGVHIVIGAMDAGSYQLYAEAQIRVARSAMGDADVPSHWTQQGR